MYKVSLEESYFPAQDDDRVLETTVGGILQSAAIEHGDRLALVEATEAGEIDRRWTYRQLLDVSERLAQGLAAEFAPGTRVAVWAPNTPEWVIFEYAAGLAGLTLVTVNPAYQPHELKYVLEQSRSEALFLTPAFRGNPMQRYAEQVQAELPGLKHLIDMQRIDGLLERFPGAQALPAVAPMDAVQVQYTSGTTGFPKGAVLHHRGLTNNARFGIERLGVSAGDIYLNPMPMFHTSGCAFATLGTTQAGATQILAKLFDPGNMVRIIESERVTAMLAVPTMLVGMAEVQETAPRDTGSLQVIGSGGAMVPPELVRRVQADFDVQFAIVFGQTETSPLLTQTRLDDSFEDRTETVGQALPCTELSIRDPATGEAVPVDVVGEICSRGYCNMLEYNDNPQATAETIDADGWLHTGDLGTMDARGYLRITGRVKEMIIRGGENLFPAEIENHLLEHAQVAEVAVVGIPDDKWGEVVAAFLRVTGEVPPLDELVAHCRAKLSPQKTPLHWVFVDEWPLTGSNKIQKFVLRDRLVEGQYAVQSR